MDDIIREIEAFCEAHGLAESAFGRLVANDTMLIAQIRDGREPRRRMREKIRQFIATYGAQAAA